MKLSQHLTALTRRAKHHIVARQCADQRGVSAVEFAMIAPLMVLMLLGSAEASLAVTVDRKTTLAASTLGDLAAQTDLVSCAELNQIGAVTRQVFEPYSGSGATMVVAGLVQNGSAARVEWSRFLRTDSTGSLLCDPVPSTHSLHEGATVIVDGSLFAPGGGLVVGDVEMAHTSIGSSFIASNMKLHERFYLRPRKSLKLRMCLQQGAGVTAATCTSTT